MNFKASISDKDIESLKDAKQHYSDCYLMTTLETLSHTENGRKILKEQIQRDDVNKDTINCYLYNPSGEKEKFSISTDYVVNNYKKLYDNQSNEIIRSMDVSVDEYEKKYKSKFWICSFTDKFKGFRFEFNVPSHFMKTLTGIEPRTIAEKDINVDLTGYKDEVMELFKKMEKEKNHSFLIATGMKMLDGHSWHVYILEDVDLKNNTITVKEKRSNKPKIMNIDTALKTFKYITGYFNSDLDSVNIKRKM